MAERIQKRTEGQTEETVERLSREATERFQERLEGRGISKAPIPRDKEPEIRDDLNTLRITAQQMMAILQQYAPASTQVGTEQGFTQFLRKRMAELGWSEAELAKVSGISKGTIHEYCNRSKVKKNPSFANVVKLSKALNLKLEDFATLIDFQE